MKQIYQDYSENLITCIKDVDGKVVADIAAELRRAWIEKRKVFICGNGGSAANAMHIANDLHYGVDPANGGLKVEALTANTSIMSCLANDLVFEDVFAYQLKVNAEPGDLLICLSGSGNSENVIRAISCAKDIGMRTCAILGFDGGKAKDMVDHALHISVNDMQISEDMQLIVGHMWMRDLAQMKLVSIDRINNENTQG